MIISLCSSSETCLLGKCGVYSCVCASGYPTKNTKTSACDDINEFETEKICDKIAAVATCTDLIGSYECTFIDKQTVWNGVRCVDKGECAYKGSIESEYDQVCYNVVPGYTCGC